MVDPLSIKCPHCTASFKIKDKSAFGKKVKCPKCETPFVIPKPVSIKSGSTRKKSKPTSLADEFFDEESDSSSGLFDDEFDGWEDDLSGGPAAKPQSSKKKLAPPKKKKKRESSFKLSNYGFSPFLTFLFAFLMLTILILFFQQSDLFIIAFFVTVMISMLISMVGLLGIFIEAAKESISELILCLFVPFYYLFYGLTRLENTKHALTTMLMGGVLFGTSFLLGYFGNISPNPKYRADSGQNSQQFADNEGSTNSNHTSPETKQEQALNEANENLGTSKPSSTPEAFSTSTNQTKHNLAATTKFDLSQIEPMLLSWPDINTSGADVYRERPTDSTGKVYEASSTFRGMAAVSPAGNRMDFRVYLPPNADPKNPVPCILVPPAGSNLLSGMPIDSAHLIPNPEHEPYLKAGFAVLTFSLDGPLLNREKSNIFELRSAYDKFQNSKAGLVNCMRALLEAQKVIPGIDKDNLFIAGHSSAGTLSLLFAEHYPQIKGCLAYVPSVDLEKSFKPHIAEIKPLLAGVEDFIKKSSPQTHIASLKCPVFLFHNPDDPVTSFADAEQFVKQLKQQGIKVEFVVGSGIDHFQPMIDEGIPKGIEWIKEIVDSSRSNAAAPQMVAGTGKTKPASSSSMSSVSQSPSRQKATFKVIGFDDYYSKLIKSNSAFVDKDLQTRVEMGLKKIVIGYNLGTVRFNLNEMLFSFEYTGELPSDFGSQFANHIFTKAIFLEKEPLSLEKIKYDPNSQFAPGNHLTFRVRYIDQTRFNVMKSLQIIEDRLRFMDRYVPDSLVVNLNEKWAYIKLKGIGDPKNLAQHSAILFSFGGITVEPQIIDLTEADLKMAGSGRATPTTEGTPTTVSSTPAATDAKQKFVIRYGVFGGNSLKIKDTVKRSLEGFVWVDQSSIKFNPDAKEISFNNRSAVDNGALERALTRNKFYQLNITQEALPEEKPASENTTPEKTEAKAGTE